MNRINNLTYNSSPATKNDINCFRGKTLILRESKVSLIKKSAKSKKSKRTNQQSYGVKNNENLGKKKDPPCQSYRFSELSRPKLKRVQSVFEKQRQKSKFDMIKAEKFVKILESSVNSKNTPGDVKKCIENKRKLAVKNKKINDNVDNFCKKINSCKHAQISFNDCNKVITKNLLKKLAICGHDGKI